MLIFVRVLSAVASCPNIFPASPPSDRHQNFNPTNINISSALRLIALRELLTLPVLTRAFGPLLGKNLRVITEI